MIPCYRYWYQYSAEDPYRHRYPRFIPVPIPDTDTLNSYQYLHQTLIPCLRFILISAGLSSVGTKVYSFILKEINFYQNLYRYQNLYWYQYWYKDILSYGFWYQDLKTPQEMVYTLLIFVSSAVPVCVVSSRNKSRVKSVQLGRLLKLPMFVVQKAAT